MLTKIRNSTSIPLLLEETFAISIIHVDGTISYTNQRFCDFSMYTKEELTGQHIEMINSEDHFEVFMKEVLEILKTESMAQKKIQRVTKNGEAYWVQATLMPILNDEGIIEQIISFEIDATSEVLTEKNI